jgi:hypothetical protein
VSVIQEELVSAERDWLAQNPIEITIKDIINGKPGYDPENGLYHIDGGVVMHTVHYRKNTKANVVQTIGLKLTRYKDEYGILVRDENGNPITLETLCVTKDEAVDLARKYGVTNGYIKTQISKKTGEKSHFIQPAPARTESFTRDDRLTFLYELNQEDGKFKKPYVLMVNQESCSAKFWLFVESDYSLKKARDKRKHQVASESKRKVEQLKVDLQKGRLGVINPFRK